jgi:hypothetical protein
MTEDNPVSSQQSTSPGGDDARVKKMLESAQKSVELLGLTKFIDDNKKAIYEQLEDCDARVSKVPIGLHPDAAFIAQSLGMIGGVIHVGSTRKNFDAAAAWVLPPDTHAEPMSVLSTLVLLYVVEKGWRDPDVSKDAAKKARWDTIYKRTKWLCEK